VSDEELASRRSRLTEKLDQHPELAEAWFERALVNAELKRRGSAVRDMARALELDKDLIHRARCAFDKFSGDPFVVDILAPRSPAGIIVRLLLSGKFEEAQRRVTSAVAAAPEDPNFLFLASQTAAALDDYEGAALFARRCILVDPLFTDAHFNLGFSQETLELHAQAIDSYGTALSIEGDHTSSAFNLILLLRRLDRHSEALEVGTAALAAQPHSLMLRYKQAETLAILCRPEEAYAQLEEIVGRDPDASREISTNEHFSRYAEHPKWQSLILCPHVI
jgi:tetratricopeptide (TPR) repeat protein